MQNRIRALRKERGWTLADLASRITPKSPTPQTLARLETGTRTLTLTWLNKIAAALEVSPQDLLTLQDGPASPVLGALGVAGVTRFKQAQEIDLSIMASEPVAIEVASPVGRFGVGDILVFDKASAHLSVPISEALVETQSGEVLFGSYFPAVGDQGAALATPPPNAILYRDVDLKWAAAAVCRIQRLT